MGGLMGLLAALALAFSATACGLARPTPEGALACSEPPDGDWRVGDRDVPGVVGMRPGEAADAFASADIAVSWRYHYGTNPFDRNVGYSECWCAAPPEDGVVMDVTPASGGWLIVMVERSGPIPGGRPQPEVGWGCETEPSDEASPSA